MTQIAHKLSELMKPSYRKYNLWYYIQFYIIDRDHHGPDQIVVGFTATYAMSAYHH